MRQTTAGDHRADQFYAAINYLDSQTNTNTGSAGFDITA